MMHVKTKTLSVSCTTERTPIAKTTTLFWSPRAEFALAICLNGLVGFAGLGAGWRVGHFMYEYY